MRRYFLLAWLLFPVPVLTYHFTRGQQHLDRREAAQKLQEIRKLENEGRWDDVILQYDELRGTLPEEEDELVLDQIALARIRASLESGLAPETITELNRFLDITSRRHGPNAPVTRHARDLLGRTHYQVAIALRANSDLDPKLWRDHLDLARRQFRYLAENANAGPDGLPAVDHLPTVSGPEVGSAAGSAAGSGNRIEAVGGNKPGRTGPGRHDLQQSHLRSLHTVLWAASSEEEAPPSAAPPPPVAVASFAMPDPTAPPPPEPPDTPPDPRQTLKAQASKRSGS